MKQQSLTLRRVLTCLLTVMILGQSLMTVADAHRLYQPLEGHVESGHEHPFELLTDEHTPLPLDEHSHVGDSHGGESEHDHDHCCHCHGSLHLFVLQSLNIPAIEALPGNSRYGFPVSVAAPSRLPRPPAV